MAQIKIYGFREHIEESREAISGAIHTAVVEVLKLPPEKRCHRFFPMEPESFLVPAEKSRRYTIIEISMFEGRAAEVKRALILSLFAELKAKARLEDADIEITLFETPRSHWGIRGQVADQMDFSYKIEI